MSASIKHIASFTEETIDTALRCTLSGDERETFEATLKRIGDSLVKSPKAKKTEKRAGLPSAKTIFYENIVPQIRQKLAEYEQQENSGVDVAWNLELKYRTDFSAITDLGKLREIHAQIVIEEQSVRNLELIVVFHRGLLYLSACNLAPVDVNIKDWFTKEFGVSYIVALRYLAFACLILRYPRLIVCGLTFSQIVKHKDRIMTYLEDDTELAAQLSVAVNIAAQNKPVDIFPSESLPVPEGKFNVDPDYIYEGYFCDPACESIPVDLKWEAYLEMVHKKGQLFDIVHGAEKIEEEELEALVEKMDMINE